MWVYEEDWKGNKLTEVINTTHENPKYLPGVHLGSNIVENADLKDSCTGADIVVFISPHQFLEKICGEIKDVIKPGAIGVTCIKGLFVHGADVKLCSQYINSRLDDIKMTALSGANVASG